MPQALVEELIQSRSVFGRVAKYFVSDYAKIEVEGVKEMLHEGGCFMVASMLSYVQK